MALFRADLDVASDAVLPEGSSPLILKSATDPQFEIRITNAPPDANGFVPRLSARVVAEAATIDEVSQAFRELLARQLDVLTFVTHAELKIEHCRRVIEWEPFKKTRAFQMHAAFDSNYPPRQDFPVDSIQTASVITGAVSESYVGRALQSFRLGVLTEDSEDQFVQFWLAIETIAEGAKDPKEIPIACPKCKGALHCETCETHPTRRPMAMDAIRALIEAMEHPAPDDVFRRISKARNQLMHGRAIASIEKDIGGSLVDLVNEIAKITWLAILRAIPVKPDPSLRFFNQGGRFEHVELIAGPYGSFDHDGKTEQPSDDQIPDIKIGLRYKPPPAAKR